MTDINILIFDHFKACCNRILILIFKESFAMLDVETETL